MFRAFASGFALLLATACSKEPPPVARDSAAAAAAPTTADSAPRIFTPSPSADTTVSWDHLATLVRQQPEQIRAVTQTHARRVVVHFKDGRAFRAVEPRLDAIVELVRSVDPAGQILIATE